MALLTSYRGPRNPGHFYLSYQTGSGLTPVGVITIEHEAWGRVALSARALKGAKATKKLRADFEGQEDAWDEGIADFCRILGLEPDALFWSEGLPGVRSAFPVTPKVETV